MGVAVPSGRVLEPLLMSWLLEDIGRGDRTTEAIFSEAGRKGEAYWLMKEAGVIAGLPIAGRVFQLLSIECEFLPLFPEGQWVNKGTIVAKLRGPLDALLTGERVALNLGMRLSGIATATNRYVEKIADLPTNLVDTRKTTPGLRILEKYASRLGGALNHRMGLDDAVMIKDNHIEAAGGIGETITKVRENVPYPLSIEVETSNLMEVETALSYGADIIMLDNMSIEQMKKAVTLIRSQNKRVKIEASGNITLDTIREVALTGVDYISSSAPITRSSWLDISMKFGHP